MSKFTYKLPGNCYQFVQTEKLIDEQAKSKGDFYDNKVKGLPLLYANY